MATTSIAVEHAHVKHVEVQQTQGPNVLTGLAFIIGVAAAAMVLMVSFSLFMARL
jgi:hypothetical protein